MDAFVKSLIDAMRPFVEKGATDERIACICLFELENSFGKIKTSCLDAFTKKHEERVLRRKIEKLENFLNCQI